MTVPLSVLDLAPISEGCDAATALRNTVDLAQHAERWGYRRFWIAEHHFVAVASSSPAVLIGQLAAATDRIRWARPRSRSARPPRSQWWRASGCSMHSIRAASIWASAARANGAPKRHKSASRVSPRPPREWREVDGVVVPPPFDPRTLLRNPRLRARMSILQQPEAVSPDFAEQVDDILAMLDGSYRVDGVDAHAVPGERAGLEPWIFGSSKGQSAQVAGARGLPFVASYHITPGTALEAIDAYRGAFTPSAAPAGTLRGGVGRRGGRRRHRHRAAPGVQLRALGVLHPCLRRCRPVSGSRHLPAVDRRAAGCRKRPHRNAIRRRCR